MKTITAVCCIIVGKEPGTTDKILLVDHVKLNSWSLPIGKVDQGDTDEFTVKKEMAEELSIKVRVCTLVDTIEKHERPIVAELGSDIISFVTHIVAVNSYTGTPRNNEPHKCRGLKWVSLDELKSMVNLKQFNYGVDTINITIKYLEAYYGSIIY